MHRLLKKRFILAPALLVLFCRSILFVAGGDNILSLGSSLRGKQTITSENGTFELGFFNPNRTNNWYVGIWYAQISDKAIVWVANRETPVRNMPGFFTLSSTGYLTLSDLQGNFIWSSNNTQQEKASRASILDTGNFVLFGFQNTSEIVWESFADPTDTFLPTMKFWKGLKLNSWRSWVDPAPGPFFVLMNSSPGTKDIFLRYKNGVSYYSSGNWTDGHYTCLPASHFSEELVVFSPTRIYYTYALTPGRTMLVRIVLNSNGQLSVYEWINNSWNLVWFKPRSNCGVYGVCGAYGVCFAQGNTQSCTCVDGFHPTNSTVWNSLEWWSSGCVRHTPLNCTTDGFLQVSDKSLSDIEALHYTQHSTVQECQTACLNNCSCTAFAFTDSNSVVCKLWFGDLLSIQSMSDSSEGQPFFIRLAASDVSQSSPAKRGRNSSRVAELSISIPLTVAILGALFMGAWLIQRRRARMVLQRAEDDTPTSLRIFTYKELKIATNNFSHQLGKGAFGCVFKGALPDKTLVAVKKLEGYAKEEKQFRAEISTVGNIHHVNLVRLRGFCVDGSNTRLLVYEYMPNGSLNSFLSRKSIQEDKVLNWKTRFGIALGTARGLLYLHEECRERIFHCDIKPENILLDTDFSPKLADFGLAKVVGRDFSRVLTTTRGTIGYLAPEWLSGMPITAKVDVYSFGMTLLEIISGRRNNDFSVRRSQQHFPTWAATEIVKGNTVGILDERIADKADVEQVKRAVVASILCIQKDENERPSTAQVVWILEGKFEGDMERYKRCLKALKDDHSLYLTLCDGSSIY